MKSRANVVWLGLTLVAVLGFLVSFVLDRVGEARVDAAPRVPHEAGEPRVRVEVLNGAGRGGLAREATRQLRDRGFDVVFYGNASDFGRDTSVVLARLGDLEAARAVADALGILAVIDDPDSARLLDVSVVLGMDWDPAPAEDRATRRVLRFWNALRR